MKKGKGDTKITTVFKQTIYIMLCLMVITLKGQAFDVHPLLKLEKNTAELSLETTKELEESLLALIKKPITNEQITLASRIMRVLSESNHKIELEKPFEYLSKLITSLPIDSTELALQLQLTNLLCIKLIDQKEFALAKKVLNLTQHLLPNQDKDEYLRYLTNSSYYHLFVGQEDSAQYFADSVYSEIKKLQVKQLEASYIHLGAVIDVNLLMGNLEKAEEVFMHWELVRHSILKRFSSQILISEEADLHFLIAGLSLYGDKGDAAKANSFFKKIKSYTHSKNFSFQTRVLKSLLINSLINYAITLRYNVNLEQAKSVNHFGIRISHMLKNNFGLSGFNGNLSFIGIDEQQPDSIYFYGKRAIAYGKKSSIPQLSNYYHLFANGCVQLGKPQEAKEALTQSLRILIADEEATWDTFHSLSLNDIVGVEYNNLTYSLEGIAYNIANLNEYDTTGEFLILAHHFYELAAQSYEEIVNLGRSSFNIEFLFGAVHEGLLNACILLNDCDIEKALITVEKNLIQTQLHHFVFNNYSKTNHKGNQELLRLKRLQNQVSEIKDNLNTLHRKSPSSLLIQQLKEKLKNKNLEIEKWNHKFNIENPKLGNIFGENVTLLSLQESLKENEAILRYHLFYDRAFLFEVTKENVLLYYLGNKNNLESEAIGYNKILHDPSSDYFPQAVRIFEKLFPNWNNLSTKNRIYIIANGKLSYLPFEALVISTGKQFIVEKKVLSYHRNLGDYLRSKKPLKRVGDGFYVFTTGDDKTTSNNASDKFAPLPGAHREGILIDSRLKPIVKSGVLATKEAFLLNAKKAKMIHLAMHSNFGENKDSSYLAFEDVNMYFNELHDLSLQADMVVLSACRTGISSNNESNQFSGIGQAFSFAGATSLVYSLWEIPDKQTTDLMTAFYKNIGDNHPKAASLQKAKIEFLNRASTNERHPYFWSGFIIQGNDSPISIKSNQKTITLVIGAILSGLFILFFFVSKLKK